MRLYVDGKVVTRKDKHFRDIAQSEVDGITDDIDQLASLSMCNEEYILDVPFTTEEVEGVVSKFNRLYAIDA